MNSGNLEGFLSNYDMCEEGIPSQQLGSLFHQSRSLLIAFVLSVASIGSHACSVGFSKHLRTVSLTLLILLEIIVRSWSSLSLQNKK